MSNDVRTRVQEIFRDIFDDDDLVLTDELSQESLEHWDSLGHIRLVSALEESLGVSFTIDDIESMSSVRQILAVLAAKH